ncbi:MAG: chloride channel protein [Ahrensia sp.]|nr:chloride channel protein [Ahrensia sp.]
MSDTPSLLRRLAEPLISGAAAALSEMRINLRAFASRRLPLVWLLSLVIGLVVAVAAILFREAIGAVQFLWLGTMSEAVVSAAAGVPKPVIFLAPVIGGLVVGILLQTVQSKQRTFSVADVMEARIHGGRGLPFWPGISSAALTAISLGSGASAGREGPMVHLGATIGASICQRLHLPDSARRVLLACGVASAVSASFNAPIAGMIFAHEVVLGHYALSAIVPIVLASVMGTLLTRLWFGDVAAFVIPDHQITSYWEFPAFALLGVTCAAVAILFQFALIATDWVSRHVTSATWLRPVIGGTGVGAIAVFFPEVLGVGYETTDAALKNNLPLHLMLTLLVAKTAATAITLASRFGGGIFSPALYLGAMAGGSFGLIAASVFPELASSEGLYSILGMGAVAAAVLGAPFSTTMIVFELTGGYTLSIALLLTVAIAYGINQAIHNHSYFQWQLETRGLFIHEGPHRSLTHAKLVMDFMDMPPPDAEPERYDADAGTPALKPSDTLETALRLFDAGGHARLPVIDEKDPEKIIAWASQLRALRYFNKALIDVSVEEHR